MSSKQQWEEDRKVARIGEEFTRRILIGSPTFGRENGQHNNICDVSDSPKWFDKGCDLVEHVLNGNGDIIDEIWHECKTDRLMMMMNRSYRSREAIRMWEDIYGAVSDGESEPVDIMNGTGNLFLETTQNVETGSIGWYAAMVEQRNGQGGKPWHEKVPRRYIWYYGLSSADAIRNEIDTWNNNIALRIEDVKLMEAVHLEKKRREEAGEGPLKVIAGGYKKRARGILFPISLLFKKPENDWYAEDGIRWMYLDTDESINTKARIYPDTSRFMEMVYSGNYDNDYREWLQRIEIL